MGAGLPLLNQAPIFLIPLPFQDTHSSGIGQKEQDFLTIAVGGTGVACEVLVKLPGCDGAPFGSGDLRRMRDQ